MEQVGLMAEYPNGGDKELVFALQELAEHLDNLPFTDSRLFWAVDYIRRLEEENRQLGHLAQSVPALEAARTRLEECVRRLEEENAALSADWGKEIKRAPRNDPGGPWMPNPDDVGGDK
jgi:hypothetical protein